MNRARWTTVPSPVGRLLLAGEGEALSVLHLLDAPGPPAPAVDGPADGGAFREAVDQLAAWWAGERTTFEVPLAPLGTPFQRAVWSALVEIPYGGTESYGALAARLGRPGSARAVGAANGRNPIAVVVPCHRVVGADGSLTGYAFGTGTKAALLAHERSVQARVEAARAASMRERASDHDGGIEPAGTRHVTNVGSTRRSW